MFQRLSQVVLATCLSTTLVACGSEQPESFEAPAQEAPHSERGGIGTVAQELSTGVTVDPRRSLAITDTAILSKFSLAQVMHWLLQSGYYDENLLFKQLWETQNPAPGLSFLFGNPHCTDNDGTLNGFAYPCRPGEGQQATTSSPLSAYTAVGIYNRFDLAPANGADCGEYRIVFANTSGPGRNFLILEAVMPNPRTDLGLEGCRPIANFLRDLSNIPSASSRGSMLTNFYFGGLSGGFPPVFSPTHYGDNPRGAGQVRTNQFMQNPWLLREFKLRYVCPPGASCTSMFLPTTVKTNPFGNLFNPSSTHPLAAEFQNSFFPTQVAALAANNINTFNYSVPDKYNVGQSDAQSAGVSDNYVAEFGTAASTFRNNIQARLTALGSTLTPDQIIARAQSQSCGGCHQRSNGAALGGGLTWPGSASFVHSSELTETGPEGPRFQISPALTNVFLPHRKLVLENYLNQLRTLSSNRYSLAGVAARSGSAAWLENNNPGYVMSVPAGGSPLVLATNRYALAGVATNGSTVYWIENRSPGEVLSVPLRGGTITSLAANRPPMGGVATDGSSVFWTEKTSPGAIMKVPTSGGTVTAVLTGRSGVGLIAADTTNLYWLEGTTLLMMPKAGGTITQLATGLNASSLSADGTNVYWTDSASPNTLKRMPVAGGTPTTIHSSAVPLTGAAVDSGYVYWLENSNPGKVMVGPK
jgi:hypothetical protein